MDYFLITLLVIILLVIILPENVCENEIDQWNKILLKNEEIKNKAKIVEYTILNDIKTKEDIIEKIKKLIFTLNDLSEQILFFKNYVISSKNPLFYNNIKLLDNINRLYMMVNFKIIALTDTILFINNFKDILNQEDKNRIKVFFVNNINF